MGFPGGRGLSGVQACGERGGIEPLGAAEHLQPVSPSRVLCKGLFCTSDGYVASCPLWSEAVLPHAPPSSQRPFNASFGSLAQIKSSGTISLLAFPLMKVPPNQLPVTVSKPESLGQAMQLLGSAERDYRDDTQIMGRQKMLSQQLEAWSLPRLLDPMQV